MSDSGHLWTHERFLQSAQNKRSLNQSNGVPNMRIQALLEATCRRLRLERKNLKREFPDDEWPPIKTEEVVEKKSRFDFVSSLCCPEGMYNNNMNNNKCELACLALMDSSLTPNKSNSLWDDPKQVEDFLRLVNHNNNYDNNNNTNNNNNNNNSNSNNNNNDNISDNNNNNDNISDNNNNNIVMDDLNNKLDFGDVSLSEEQTTNQMSSLVSNYDVNSFTVEFDNLYKELVQNLITVESLMSQSACS